MARWIFSRIERDHPEANATVGKEEDPLNDDLLFRRGCFAQDEGADGAFILPRIAFFVAGVHPLGERIEVVRGEVLYLLADALGHFACGLT